MDTALLVVFLVLVVLAIVGVMLCVVPDMLAERRERRLALQRALIVQAANQRLRSVSREALGAMLNVVEERFDRRA